MTAATNQPDPLQKASTTSKWEPVIALLGHMSRDEELLLNWALLEVGEVRSHQARAALVKNKRADLRLLTTAVRNRSHQQSRGPVKMSDCPSPLGTVCAAPTCPVHFG